MSRPANTIRNVELLPSKKGKKGTAQECFQLRVQLPVPVYVAESCNLGKQSLISPGLPDADWGVVRTSPQAESGEERSGPSQSGGKPAEEPGDLLSPAETAVALTRPDDYHAYVE
jgi:hypothetical protein